MKMKNTKKRNAEGGRRAAPFFVRPRKHNTPENKPCQIVAFPPYYVFVPPLHAC